MDGSFAGGGDGLAPARPRRTPPIPDAVFGTLMFVCVEVMLFAGFYSAYTLTRSSFPPGGWPPADQPRLPIEVTAVTSSLLLASGVLAWRAGARFAEGDRGRAKGLLAGAAALGAIFVGVQGVEWTRLLAQGLTMQSSTYGAFFYLIVGTHALHAIPAIGFLVDAALRLHQGRLNPDRFTATRIFWYFVVLVWPIIYLKVYL